MKRRLRLGVIVSVVVLLAPGGWAQVDMQQKLSGQLGSNGGRTRADAAGQVQANRLSVVPEDFARLRLAPGYLIQVNIPDDQEFGGNFRVNEQGDVEMPVLGLVHVAGLTVSEARAKIRKLLVDGQYLKDPRIDVTVEEYTASQVTILGEVVVPGRYPLLAAHRLVDVLALAGGTTLLAGDEVQITRASVEVEPVLVHYSRDTSAKDVERLMVEPGDTVQVKRAGIVYVLGAVNRPGGYVMQEAGKLNALQAIALASGTTLTASTGKIYLLRHNRDGSMVYITLPYKNITRGKSADVQLQATDVIYVPSSALKAALTDSQAILSAAASASIYAGTGH